jgi:membrane protease YdiL (CAAX protease family)
MTQAPLAARGAHSVPVFLLALVVASLPFYLLLNLSGGSGQGMRLYVAGLMWCPALAAFLACRAGGIRFAALGWTWPRARLAWAALLVPLLYALAIYGIAWSTGLGAFSLDAYAGFAAKSLGLPDWPAWARVALMLALQASAGLVLSCATALGEEIGWRGFLAPRLLAHHGFVGGSLAVGLLWAAWHVPVLFWMNFAGTPPRPFAIACFTTSLVGMSFVYSWFRLRSDSLWPAVLLHASHNVWITPVFSLMTVDTGTTAYAIDEFGFLLAIASIAMAAWCWRHPPTTAGAIAGTRAGG